MSVWWPVRLLCILHCPQLHGFNTINPLTVSISIHIDIYTTAQKSGVRNEYFYPAVIYIYIYIHTYTYTYNFFIHFNTVCHKTADKYCNNRPLGLFFHYCIFFYYYLKLYEVYKLLTFSLMNNSEKQEVKFHHKDRWAALHDLYIHVFRAESSTNREEMSSSTPASLRAMQV